MIPKNWRINFFNWLSAGRMTLTKEYKQEKQMSYALNNMGGISGIGAGQITINPQHSSSLPSTLNFNVTKANGGWIIQVNKSSYDNSQNELYIITEESDFDKELGKIVTLSCLKS